MRRTLAPIIFSFLLAALSAGLWSCSSDHPSIPRILHGTLDLSNWDWASGSLRLKGSWLADGHEVSVPDTWKGQGSRNYRLTVLVGEQSPRLGIRYTSVVSALSVTANLVLLATAGHADLDPSRTIARYQPNVVELPQASVLNLDFLVSNQVYRFGGLWDAPEIGPFSVLLHDQWLAEIEAVGMTTGLAVLGFAALFFFFYQRSRLEFLFFGLLALVCALRSLVTGEYVLVKEVPLISFDLLIRLEYSTAFLPLPIALLFFCSYLEHLFRPWIKNTLITVLGVFAVFPFAFPLPLLTQALPVYQCIALLALLYSGTIVIRRLWRGRRNYFLLFGFFALATAAFVDFVDAGLLNTAINVTPWGLAIFIVLQAMTIGRDMLSRHLAAESLLVERDLLIKEIHHRVKNSLQVAASLVSLQGNRADPSQASVFQSLRRRITAIALVHEKLYGKGLSGTLDLGEYLSELIQLQYPDDSLAVIPTTWRLSFAKVQASVDRCVDLGLILTELLSNAHKHGIPQGGVIHVVLEQDESNVILAVTDDGPGFQDGGTSNNGLGFRLIEALLGRNHGQIIRGPKGRVEVRLKREPGPAEPPKEGLEDQRV